MLKTVKFLIMKIQAACMRINGERKMPIVLRDTLIHWFSTLEENKSLITAFDQGRLCLTRPGIHENGHIRIWNPLQ